MKTENCRVCGREILVSKIYDAKGYVKTVNLDPTVPVYIAVNCGERLIAKKAESSMAEHICDKIAEFAESTRKRQEEYDAKHPHEPRLGERAA